MSTPPRVKMPSYLPPIRRLSTYSHADADSYRERQQDDVEHVYITPQIEEAAAQLHQSVTDQSTKADHVDPPFRDFEEYIRTHDRPLPLSVCFKNLMTYGQSGGAARTKTAKDAVWRTLTMQDIYESTIQPFLSSKKSQGRPLIRDFSGVVRNGQMML